jgi:site-specific DNA recombinase
MKKSNMSLNSSQPIHNSNPKTKSENGCFVYTRVSTDRQADEGYSLDEQERSCKELAQRIGYKVLGVYREEGVSGTSINRPKFQEMLGKCSDDKGKTVKAVIVIHTDRFARNTLEHLMVKGILLKTKVNLISVLQPMLDDSPEGNLLDIILAGMNEFYSKDLGRKTARALDQKAQEGWWPGFAPLGYLNKTHPETKSKIIVTDEEKSFYITEAFKRFASGKYTIKKLNDELFHEGFRSRTGRKLHKSRMAAMLRNIFYAGKLKIKGKIYQGKHEPLTDMTT